MKINILQYLLKEKYPNKDILEKNYFDILKLDFTQKK